MPFGLGGAYPLKRSDAVRPFHFGDGLAFERQVVELTHLDIAQADGKWTTQDVVDVENERDPLPRDWERYKAALRKATEAKL